MKARGDIKDKGLAASGKKRVEWAEHEMPVLRAVRARFEKEKPLKGVLIGACLHVTTETANLCRTLQAGGAEVAICASNPLSTQDDTAAALLHEYGVHTFAIHGEDSKSYYKHIDEVLDLKPRVTLDDGGDLVTRIHKERTELIGHVRASLEETTTGVIRLRAMERDRALKIPVVAVNDAETKYLFDNRYGTGQSTVDGIIRATNILFAGKIVVCAGYGWCGRGFAQRARGLGARVLITEVNPIRALEAAMDGYDVVTMKTAAPIGDIFCTVTGNKSVVRREHFEKMKDGAILANSGHFNVEIDLEDLAAMAKTTVEGVRPNVDQFKMKDGRSIFVLGEGRLVNLACAEGHPASVMDMSFSTQALAVEHVLRNGKGYDVRVHKVPRAIEEWISALKLESMGMELDKLTPEQEKYLASWEEGT